MAWVKVKWIDPMFAAFNAAFPHRNKASDGTVGDLAHAQGTSGHNPDDTPGVQAERQDADSKQEVRAADVTSKFNDPDGVKMYDVIQVMLQPQYRDELNRLIYIICDGWIWRKANGWKRETYTGSDKHFSHGHFSGDPASDEDSRPWNSILHWTMEENAVALEDFNSKNINFWRQAKRVETMLNNEPTMVDGSVTETNQLAAKLALIHSQASSNGSGISDLHTKVNTLTAGGVTQEMLNAAMVHALQQPAVLEALGPVIQENAFLGSQQAEQE